MKKTIVILILVVYVASIAVVNFFGLEIKQFDGTKYVESIQVNSITLQNENSIVIYPKFLEFDPDPPTFEFDFIDAPFDQPYSSDEESIIKNPNAVQIDYEVFPHIADNTAVKFEWDTAAYDGCIVFHELSRTFVFLKPNKMITITIKATDGSAKSTVINIIGK